LNKKSGGLLLEPEPQLKGRKDSAVDIGDMIGGKGERRGQNRRGRGTYRALRAVVAHGPGGIDAPDSNF